MSYRYANLPIEQVRPNAKNTRTHSKKQIRQIATSIRELGFAAPVLWMNMTFSSPGTVDWKQPDRSEWHRFQP